MTPNVSRIPPLDGVRGLAALLVLFYRYWQFGGFAAFTALGPFFSALSFGRVSDPRFVVFGETGVDLFFVLSGFLITRILIAAKGGKGYFRNFYARRVLRIFPLYYLFLVIFYFAVPALRGQSFLPWGRTWWYWTYLHNVPAAQPASFSAGPIHYWSLAVEEHYYLFWPLVVALVPSKRLGRICWALVAAAAASRAAYVFFWHGSVMQFTPFRMDSLALGGLLAFYEWRGDLMKKGRLFLAALALSAPAALWYWASLPVPGGAPGTVFKYFWIAVFYWALVGAVLVWRSAPAVTALFSNRPLRFTGKISYGLYVYHVLVFELLLAAVPGLRRAWWGLPLSLSAVYLTAWASFRFYETPFLEMKKRFSSEGGGPRRKQGRAG